MFRRRRALPSAGELGTWIDARGCEGYALLPHTRTRSFVSFVVGVSTSSEEPCSARSNPAAPTSALFSTKRSPASSLSSWLILVASTRKPVSRCGTSFQLSGLLMLAGGSRCRLQGSAPDPRRSSEVIVVTQELFVTCASALSSARRFVAVRSTRSLSSSARSSCLGSRSPF